MKKYFLLNPERIVFTKFNFDSEPLLYCNSLKPQSGDISVTENTKLQKAAERCHIYNVSVMIQNYTGNLIGSKALGIF